MTNFEKWKDRHDKGWASTEQLQRLVVLNVLTQAEYDLIVM
jgi:hypothetical protein